MRSRNAIEFGDVAAATLIVGKDLIEADFLTIQEAIANLPSTGGTIYVMEGTYSVPAGGFVLPDKPVRIEGSGNGTVIDLAGAADPAFSVGFVRDYTITDLFVTGSVADVNRRVLSISVPATVRIDRLTGTNIRTVIEITGGTTPIVELRNSKFTLLDNVASWFVNGGGTTTLIRAYAVEVTGPLDKGGIFDPIPVELYSCTLSAANGFTILGRVMSGCLIRGVAGETVTLRGAQGRVSDCHFQKVTVDTTGFDQSIVNCVFEGDAVQANCLTQSGFVFGQKIDNCIFLGATSAFIVVNDSDVGITNCRFRAVVAVTRNIDVAVSATRTRIVGCNFELGTAESVRIAASRCVLEACTNGVTLPKVTETGAANFNRYSGISQTSTLVGTRSIIDPWNDRTTLVGITLDQNDRTIRVDATAAPVTIALPTAASGKHWVYTIKKIDATGNAVTIDAAAAETIDGALTQVLSLQYRTLTIQSNGVSWDIITPQSSGGDIYAATRIVSLIPGEGTDLTIAAALAGLPADGGLIFVKQGTYPIAAPLVIPNKNVRIVGAAGGGTFGTTGATELVPAAGIALFDCTALVGKNLFLSDFAVTGDNLTDQKFLDAISAHAVIERVSITSVRGIILASGTPEVSFLECKIQSTGTPAAAFYFWKSTTGSDGELTWDQVECTIVDAAATIVSGLAGGRGPTWKVVNSYFGGGGGGGSTNFYSLSRIEWVDFDLDNAEITVGSANCTMTGVEMIDSSIKFLGVWNRIVNCVFSQGGTGGALFGAQVDFAFPIAGINIDSVVSNCVFYGNFVSLIGIQVLNVLEVDISGCLFSHHLTTGVLLAAGTVPNVSKASVIGCRFDTTANRVLEGDANCVGRYAGNENFGAVGGAIVGPDSTVEGMRRKDLTAVATTGAFVTQFTHTNYKGLLGIGTIKNTGGVNSLEVRETVTDAFGVTDSVTTTVLAGNDYLLDLQTNFATARPPYVSYAVEVRHPVAATTFSLRHGSQGAA